MHVRDPAAVRRLAGRVPVFYYVFDLLRLDDRPLLQLPYTERRGLLDDLELDTPTWRVPPSFPGPAADVMAASAQHGLEGIVAKRRASAYRPGQRSPDWRKVEAPADAGSRRRRLAPWPGRRAGRIGSLILGVPTTAATCSTSAASAPGSPTACSTSSRSGWRRCDRTPVPSRHRSPEPRRATPSGSAPTSSVKWPTPNGPATATSATPPGEDCDRTKIHDRSTASSGRR